MKDNIRTYTSILKKYGIKATFFITVKSIASHKEFLSNIENAELAVHGYQHLDYTAQPLHIKKEHTQKINMGLKNFDFLINGFRAPYLKQDSDMLKLLADTGFLFDSSTTKLWALPQELINKNKKAYERALALYTPKDFELPYSTEKILEIPVSLPDDEILIDRFGIKNPKIIEKIWLDILNQTYENKSLFVLQLHPERIRIAADALKGILEEAKRKSPPIWIASLSELATWWISKPKNKRWPKNFQSALCITGDIDRMSLLK
jgi:peptidoglycan/xylan/chitin deacetylase (PgdA/CDA1 family)